MSILPFGEAAHYIGFVLPLHLSVNKTHRQVGENIVLQLFAVPDSRFQRRAVKLHLRASVGAKEIRSPSSSAGESSTAGQTMYT